MKENTRNSEVKHAFESISDKAKSAIAQCILTYTCQHHDGKFYIQLNAETADGSKLSGYLPFGFTEEQSAIDFQEMCFNWFIRLN